MDEYRSFEKTGSATVEERKSVFHGVAAPVRDEEEALFLLSAEKKKYPDAKHHVYAYRLRDRALTRFSDDREPSGTAGKPLLDLLTRQDITDAILIVTRYFGGTLLGTGGLVRCYTAAGQGAIADAGIACYRLRAFYMLTLSYGDYQKILPFLSSAGFRTESTDFHADVRLCGSVFAGEETLFERKITELTAARAKIVKTGEKSSL